MLKNENNYIHEATLYILLKEILSLQNFIKTDEQLLSMYKN
jgi:hypothetical protein